MSDQRNVDPIRPDLELLKLELERYKVRLDYRKFVLASVFAAITIAAIPPSFQLATAYLEYTRSSAERLVKQEEFYEKYVKDFLENALTQDIELRIRFAEYFASVSAQSFRENWTKYHNNLVKHRDEIRQQINQLEAEWSQVTQRQAPDDTHRLRVERTLGWIYNEVGYVEHNRSVTANPRASSDVRLTGKVEFLEGDVFCVRRRWAGLEEDGSACRFPGSA